jgi:4-carboxymuconolactone decarboxylase
VSSSVRRGCGGAVIALAALATITASAVAGAQQLPIENIQLRGDRFRGLHYREMTPEQRVMLDHVVNSARAVTNTTANGPFNVLLRSPEVGDLSQQLGNTLRFASGLSGRLREIATLMAGRAWSSRYEWYAHARYAANEQIPASVIQAIAEHRTPDLASMPVEDATVWRVADELLYTRRVSDAAYNDAVGVLGEQRLLISVLLAAYYEYVSMILNVDRYPLPADAPPPAHDALKPLPLEALYREPTGRITPRAALSNEDTERALAAISSVLSRDGELPASARDAATRAVLRQWNRGPKDAHGDIAYRFATELFDAREVTDQTFAAAVAALGERRLVDLLVLMGHSNLRCAQLALAGRGCVL